MDYNYQNKHSSSEALEYWCSGYKYMPAYYVDDKIQYTEQGIIEIKFYILEDPLSVLLLNILKSIQNLKNCTEKKSDWSENYQVS